MTTTEAPSQASPEGLTTTWMDSGDAAAAGTLLAPPSSPPAAAFAAGEGSPYPYEGSMGGAAGHQEAGGVMEGAAQAPAEEEVLFRYQGAATLLMDTYLGPVATRPVPVTPVNHSTMSATVVAIRPPLRTGARAAAVPVGVARPAWSLTPSEAQQLQQHQQQQQLQQQQHKQRQAAGLLTRAVRGYTSLLERHYHLVSFLQATLLGVVGDTIAQGIEAAMAGGGLAGALARGFRPNLVRTGNVAFLAAIIGMWVGLEVLFGGGGHGGGG